MAFLEHFVQTGVWASLIWTCFVLGIILCAIDGFTRGQKRLSSICLALTGTIILVGLLGLMIGLKLASIGAASIGTENFSPEQRQQMVAGGMATALDASKYALLTAGVLLGLTMSIRLSHRPSIPNKENGVS